MKQLQKQELAWLEDYVPPIAKYAMDGAPFSFVAGKIRGGEADFSTAMLTVRR
jgi:hypothetical protein